MSGDDLLKLAEQRVTRDFTIDERERYAGYLGDENQRILDARERVRRMAAELLLAEDVRAAIRDDTMLTEQERELSRTYAEGLKDAGPNELNGAAWKVASTIGRDDREYRRALRWAEAAVQATPGNTLILNTLGVAQYRAGDLDAAMESLTRCDAAHSEAAAGGNPADVAFLAMAAHKLGKDAEAEAYMARLRELMERPAFAQDSELKGFHAEAESELAETTR
jgi:predicted Zn-dependent protease